MSASLACLECGWGVVPGAGRGKTTGQVFGLLCCGTPKCPWVCFAILSRERAATFLADRELEVVDG